MFETFVCKILIGAGVMNLLPGVHDAAPRYADAEVFLTVGRGYADVFVAGGFDNGYSYQVHGLSLAPQRVLDRWFVDVKGEGLNPLRETLVLTDDGKLLWSQMSNASEIRATAASIYEGTCKPSGSR